MVATGEPISHASVPKSLALRPKNNTATVTSTVLSPEQQAMTRNPIAATVRADRGPAPPRPSLPLAGTPAGELFPVVATLRSLAIAVRL